MRYYAGMRRLSFHGLPVGAAVMEPAEFTDELRGEFDAFGVDGKAPFVDSALPRNHVQVTAGSPGEENGPLFVFDFFEAAEAASVAEGFPGIFVVHGIIHPVMIPNDAGSCQWTGGEMPF